jgi:hypothetical protein
VHREKELFQLERLLEVETQSMALLDRLAEK